MTSLISQIEDHAASAPSALAVFHRQKYLTYAELNCHANQVAHGLLAKGVGAGQTVAVLAHRGFAQMIALLAVAKTGAGYLPLDPEMPTQRLMTILQDSGCLGCLVDDVAMQVRLMQTTDLLSVTSHQPIWLIDELQGSAHNPQLALSADQPFYTIYTSGSTGQPKGAVVLRAGAENLYAWYAEIGQFDASWRPLLMSSIGFDLTQKNIWTAWRQGACLYLPNCEHYDAQDLLTQIHECQITSLNCTPTAMKGLMLGIDDHKPLALVSLRWVFLGGEALYLAPFKAWFQHPQCQTQLVNSYGPTECSDVVSFFIVPKNFPDDQQAPIGKAIPQMVLTVLNDQLQPIDDDEMGECAVGGIGVGAGYPKNPDLTQEKFIQHAQLGRIYLTGDLVKRLPSGDLLYCGRRDHQVKIRGFRIELGEIEQALINHPAIENAAVIATQETASQLAAYIVWKSKISISRLRADLQATLPDYMLPTLWMEMSSLPLNANGKVDRRALPSPRHERPDLNTAYVPAKNALEQWLLNQWQALLQLQGIGVLDRFFELGGTSLLAIEFIGALAKSLDTKLSMADFFADPTIRAYSQVLLTQHREVLPEIYQVAITRDNLQQVQKQQAQRKTSFQKNSEIAIVGMAGRFPGADSIEQFWANLLAARSSLEPVVFEALAKAGVDPAIWQETNYVKWCAPLTDIESFDASFFGYTPKEVQWMDPQQRLLLEVAWWALEDAGYDPLQVPGLVGVFAGVAHNGYLLHHLAANPQLRDGCRDYLGLLGNEKDFPATRVAFKFNLQGPAVNVQTACSSSAVALHLACNSLRQGECDAALVGGGRVLVPHRVGYLSVEGGPLSANGQTRAFDAQASGMVRGSGMSMLVIKRLADALADGDCIRAVIKGSAINNDGANKIGFTAPSVHGQATVIQAALQQAGVQAHDIGYVETHGTATRLGDPIEMAGLSRAYGSRDTGLPLCRIGSLKSNIGHLDAGAAVASVIKTSLMLQHAQMPASLHCDQPNPDIEWQKNGFVVNQQTQPWLSEQRLAGVSAFGLGGTNAHIVLAQSPVFEKIADSTNPQVCSFTAKTPQALQALLQSFAEFIPRHPELNLAQLAYTLQVGRHRFAYGVHFVANTLGDLQQQLTTATETSLVLPVLTDAPVVFLFPGQGSQSLGMAHGLYQTYDVFKNIIDTCCEFLKQRCDLDLFARLMNRDDELIAWQATVEVQPALFVVEYALAKLWQSIGVTADLMIGHSIGEWVAATLAGVFSLEDALSLVALRGKLMQSMPAGAMLAVMATPEQLQPYLSPDVSLAAINTPTRCVLSGTFDAIEQVQQRLQTELRLESQRLHTSHAFHSPMMLPMLAEFEAVVAAVSRHPAQAAAISSASGQAIMPMTWCEPSYWSQQIIHAVQFAPAIATAQAHCPQAIWLEVGPHRVLSQGLSQGQAQSALNAQNYLIVASQPHPKHFAQSVSTWLQAVGQLWQVGQNIDYSGLYLAEQRRRVPLPTYVFQRQRFWIEAPALEGAAPMLGAGSQMSAVGTQIADSSAPPITAEPLQSARANDHSPLENRQVQEPDVSQQIAAEISKVSGIQLHVDDYQQPLIALGLDSLLLTQLGAQLKRQFKVAIGLRELMDTHPTVQALAELIAERAPSLSSATPPAASKPVRDKNHSPATQTQSTTQSTTPAKAFGAQTRIQLQRQVMSETQQQAINELLTLYIQKTARSKKFTADNRAQLADPRAVSGFNPTLKEAVYPLVIQQSQGAYFTDIDGHRYLDVTSGFGAILLGHNPDIVKQALIAQLQDGVEIGPQHPKVAYAVQAMCRMTGHERVAFCNTGSEAVMGALRIARTVTGRDRIVIFTDDYHGIFDEVIVRAGADAQGIPAVAGIPFSQTQEVWVLAYGDADSLDFIAEHADEIAAVVVEPVQSRRLHWQPRAFVQALRTLTRAQDIALIFDEVITGFRCHQGGAQAYFGVRADIATYGKIIGGGLPIGAIAGCAKYMDALDGGRWQYGDDSRPEVGVTYFAGTFVRHPLTLAACCATLAFLEQQGPQLQAELNHRCELFLQRLQRLAERLQAPLKIAYFSSAFRIEWDESFTLPGLFYIAMRLHGIHIYEGRTWFMTLAHGEAELNMLLAAFEQSIVRLQQQDLLPKKMPQLLSPAMKFNDVIASTEPQQEIYAAVQMGDDSNCSFNESIALKITGNLQQDALQLALNAMILRHPLLVATFTHAGQQLLIPHHPQLVYAFIDLRAGDVSDRLAQLKIQSVTQPYNLLTGPLFKVILVQVHEDYHELLLCAHHILCDGWSYSVMVRELGHLYAAALKQAVNPQQLAAQLPWPPQFADYAKAQYDVEARTAQQQSLTYWLTQYPLDNIPQMDLPTDKPRQVERTYHAKRLDLDLGADLVQAIRDDAIKHNVSVVTWLLTTFLMVLQRWTQQDDLLVGLPASGQAASGQSQLIGHCVNVLPLRLPLDGQGSALSALQLVRLKLLEAYEHQALTFGQLLKHLPLSRDPGRIPLLPLLFNIDVMRSEPYAYPEVDVQLAVNPRHFDNFECTLNLMLSDHALQAQCTFNTDLWFEPTWQRRLYEWRDLMRGLTSGTISWQSPLTQVPLALPDNRFYWQGPTPVLPNADLGELLQEKRQQFYARTAVVFQQHRLTYQQLQQQIDVLLPHVLNAPSDVIAVCLDRGLDLLVALLTVWQAGKAYVPVDPDYPADRIAYMLDHAKPSVIITDRFRADDFTGRKVLSIDQLPSVPQSSLTRIQSQLAYVIYTSGSTGVPKGVAIKRLSVVNFLQSMQRAPGLRADDVLVAVTTISFDIAVLELFLPLWVGAQTVIADRLTAQDGDKLKQLLVSTKATALQATPTTWQLLLAAGWTPAPEFKALCGGEAMSPNLAQQLLAKGCQLWNMYGPTETAVWSACRPITAPEQVCDPGDALDHTELAVLDQSQQPSLMGAFGELYIGGVGLAAGYRDQPQMTDERFVELDIHGKRGRWYRTGDRVQVTSEQRLRWVGRIDNQIKLRGFRIELGEIENQLQRCVGITAVAVSLIAVSEQDLRLVAFYESASDLDSTVLRQQLQPHLPGYMLPTHWQRLEHLPRLPNGKLNRNALAAQVKWQTTPSATIWENSAEEYLAQIWQHVLVRNDINRHHNFFEIGGHSLLAMESIARIRLEHDINMTLREWVMMDLKTLAAVYPQLGVVKATSLSVTASTENKLTLKSKIVSWFKKGHSIQVNKAL